MSCVDLSSSYIVNPPGPSPSAQPFCTFPTPFRTLHIVTPVLWQPLHSKHTMRLTTCFMASALRQMVTQHHIPFCILPSNGLFQQPAYLRTSVNGVSQPDLNRTTLTAYLSISRGKRPPLFTNQLADLCDTHTGHVAGGNAVLQEKTISIKGLLH